MMNFIRNSHPQRPSPPPWCVFVFQWDEFMSQIEVASSRIPWQVGLGNHERDYPNSGSLPTSKDSGGECGIPMERIFPLPSLPNAKIQSQVANTSPSPSPSTQTLIAFCIHSGRRLLVFIERWLYASGYDQHRTLYRP